MSLAVSRCQSALRRCGKVRLCGLSLRPRRTFTLSALDPTVRQFVVNMAEHQPCYPMSSTNVSIMHQPKDFYQTLLSMIRRARQRLFISSLYIGSEDSELIDTINASLRAKPSLHVHMHLDYNRCTRPELLSTANLLLPLLKEFPDRVHVWLFRSPKLKGLMSKIMPPRFNEGWGGTWHPKIYGVDDELLISGANLNTSYFTDRQDRYIHLTAQPQLAQYCFSFLEHASTFSYSLLPSASEHEKYILHWSDLHTHPHHFEEKAQKTLTAFQDACRKSSLELQSYQNEAETDAKSDVLIFPIIQAGQFNIREEERCLDLLFGQYEKPTTGTGAESSGPLLDLTSGYFGLYKPYQELIIHSNTACRVLAASPKANGFYGSKGVSGRIPEGYTVLERRFMKAVRAAGREWRNNEHSEQRTSPGVQLSEWEKDGWTYHAKGIWLRPTPFENPLLTLFGSTNLNSRSANIDTELSFVLVTTASTLRARLADEVDGLRAHAHPWRGTERRVRPGSWLLASALRDRL